MKTGGPIRGWLARWVMRIEASGVIMRTVLLGVTAASTLTSALLAAGVSTSVAIAVLAVGIVVGLVTAYGYVEFGIHNRKNRERDDRGDNYIAANYVLGELLDGRNRAHIWAAALDVDPEPLVRASDQQVIRTASELRDGIDIDELLEQANHPDLQGGLEHATPGVDPRKTGVQSGSDEESGANPEHRPMGTPTRPDSGGDSP